MREFREYEKTKYDYWYEKHSKHGDIQKQQDGSWFCTGCGDWI